MAIVIDPNRDIERYVEAAEREHVRIAFVTETHIHADFVSGSAQLARRVGATLLLSGDGDEQWRYGFAESEGARLLHHGDTFELGAVRFDVRHTPGHTPEHLSFVVTDTATSARPLGMLSGDFIFVGDVGRPDLLERTSQADSARGSADALARKLFQSLRAIADLPDYLQLWPGHGAGSACGKALGAMPSTTLGYERVANWAFQIDDEDRFVAEAIAGQPEPPKYFARMKAVNRDGPAPAPARHVAEVNLAGLRRAMDAGASIVDVRSTADFARGHIPGAINLPTGTSFTTWAGSLLPDDRDIVLLADDHGRIERARASLALIGLDRVTGYGGAAIRDAWRDQVGALQQVEQVGVDTLATTNHRTIVDVRGATEWAEGHVPQAQHLFLGDLVALTRDLPRDTPLALHCQGGTRSAIAASLLQAEGFTHVANVTGGFTAWETAGLPVVKSPI